MAKRIKMLATAAYPDAIYHEGKTYILPDELADAILAAGSGADLKSAAGILASKGDKLSKPQAPPDPESGKGDEIDEDDDDLEDE
jgi:hypothetical protein